MEKFYLEEPNLQRKNDVLDYLDELVKYGSELNGTGCMDRCLSGWTYEDVLIETEKRKDKNYAYSINRCPSKTFFFVRQNDNKIIGMTNIRYDITDDLLKSGASHIGYSIRPSERQKGYNKIQLFLGLLEEQKIGEKELLLECTIDNKASNKTILALGGILEKTAIDKNDNTMTNYYLIDVEKSISDNYSKYNNYIAMQ